MAGGGDTKKKLKHKVRKTPYKPNSTPDEGQPDRWTHETSCRNNWNKYLPPLAHINFLGLELGGIYGYILIPTSNTTSLCFSLKSKYYSIIDDLAHIFKFFRNLKFVRY